MSEIKRACIYTRVSTDEQVKNGYSLEEQESQCRAQIEAYGWRYIRTYSDPGESGRKRNRAGLNEMLSAIEAGEIDAVVIWKLDRLSRKQRDTLEIIEDVMIKNNISLVSLNERLDIGTSLGRTIIGVLSAFSQMESENIQERTQMGRMAKAEKGGYAGGKPPIGYRVSDGEFVIIPEEADIVRTVFQLREQGMTLIGIADELNNRGYKTRTGNHFLHSAVQTILNNEQTYRGVYKYGKGPEVKNHHEPILKEDE